MQVPARRSDRGVPERLLNQMNRRSAIKRMRGVRVPKPVRRRHRVNSGASGLGGHVKTGHTWTPENRPTEQNQNKNFYTLPEVVRANQFSHIRLILISPGRRIWQRWEATGAPTQRPEWLGAA